ncbi:hypothetical protein [Demequina litorisediminis]|uniref:Gram-positive cocci surface proteins LPxTG domain-containing protein n=1 Tax=Demequina litorisediminis TaxID=1849022 RepID=A0ABQ6II76_9MICO|nr:hypothetical protein [Demequina litorisediminis]GMA36423.1 hypothetical protein GCM10025876_26270 [Demequina litorisediminis]
MPSTEVSVTRTFSVAVAAPVADDEPAGNDDEQVANETPAESESSAPADTTETAVESESSAQTDTTTDAAVLSDTGADSAPLAATAVLLVLVGAALVLRRRAEA